MSVKEKLYIDVKLVISPSDFTACIGKLIDFSEFDKFLKKLNKWCDENAVGGDEQPLEPNQSVLVKVKEDEDELEWKRAIVRSIEKNETVKCYLIDDGQTVQLNRDKIYTQKPEFFEEQEAHAKKCLLKGAIPENGSEWSQPANELFRMLLKQPGLIVNEIEPMGGEKPNNFAESINARYVIEILNKNKSLLDTLVSDGFATMNDPTFILTNKATTTSTTVSTPVDKLAPELSFGKNQLTSNADDMSSVEMASQPSANGKQADDDECIFLTETQPNAYNDDNDDVVECEGNEIKESITTSSISSLNTSTNKYPKKIRPSADKSSKSSSARTANACTSDQVRYIDLVQDDENDADEPEEDINAYFTHRSTTSTDNIPIIKSRNFICSDETILTGYTPNIKIDGNQVTRAIRMVQLDRINKSKGITITDNVEKLQTNKHQAKILPAGRNPKIHSIRQTKNSEIYENKIYEIMSGSNGFFPTLESKISHLNKIFHENQKENGSLILKCFLKELSNENIDCDYAFNIIQHLNFVNDSVFDRTLHEFLVDNGLWSNGNSPYTPQITDSQRKSICQAIANIYLRSLECPLVNCLKNMSTVCCELVKEWITIYVNREISNHVYVRNLKNVHNFLEICMNKFCLQNLEIIDFVRQKSRVYSCDHALSNDIRAESVLILELFALKYLDVLQGRIDNEKVSLTRSNTRSITPLMSGNFNQSRNNSFSNVNPNKNRNGNNNNNNNNSNNNYNNNNINYGYNDTRTSWTNTFRRDWAAAERSDQSSNETDDFNQRGRFAYRMNDSSNWHNNNNSSSNSYLNNDFNRNNNLHNNSYDDTYNNGNYNNNFNNVNRIHESNLLAQRLEFFTQQFTSMSTASRYPSKRKSNNFN